MKYYNCYIRYSPDKKIIREFHFGGRELEKVEACRIVCILLLNSMEMIVKSATITEEFIDECQ